MGFGGFWQNDGGSIYMHGFIVVDIVTLQALSDCQTAAEVSTQKYYPPFTSSSGLTSPLLNRTSHHEDVQCMVAIPSF